MRVLAAAGGSLLLLFVVIAVFNYTEQDATSAVIAESETAQDAALKEAAAQKSEGEALYHIPLYSEKGTHMGGLRYNLLQKMKGDETALRNYGNTVFYAKMKIGTPSRTFKMVLDTGSFILWVPDNICKSAPCLNHERFSVYKSKSGKVLQVTEDGKKRDMEGVIHYGTGAMEGVEITDIVTVADVSTRMGLLVAVKEATEPFLSSPFDGIVGLGRADNKIQGYNFNFMSAAQATKAVKKNIISFYFTLKPHAAGGKDGVVVVGGTDSSLYDGPLRYHPVLNVGPKMWTLDLDALYIGKDGTNVCKGGCVGIIDTGTSLMITSPKMAVTLNKELAVDSNCKNLGSAPPVHLVFKGSKYAYHLPAHAVTLEGENELGEKACQPAIQSMGGMALEQTIQEVAKAGNVGHPERRLLGGAVPTPGGSPWDTITAEYGGRQVVIVGDIFLRHHYAAFDNTDPANAKVGFATAKKAVDLESF
jgi:cathepsin D